ncbi:MAG: hypothetical protein GQ546_07315 [Gammaproteobacteria bacterium]|nr:hypothetical protein [Gammaproteobacteria bacterium]
MTDNMPIDEYVFWKNIIEEKQERGEFVPEMMYELLEQAQKKTMYYLIDLYSVNDKLDNSDIINERSLVH